MKYTFIFFLLQILFLMPGVAQQKSLKRGISQNGFTYPEEIRALEPGVGWYYNWGPTPNYNEKDHVGTGHPIEFIPMCWNGNFNETAIREYLAANPGCKYLLGFNEPNFVAQANMTPAQAAEIWPRLEKIAADFGLELVGPALNYSPDAPYSNPITWYDEFFALYPEAKVDYLALHCYMVGSDGMMSFINSIADRYHKKIWLTEFCAWDGLTTVEENARAVQKNEMVRKLEELELSPNVARYSWFMAKGRDAYPYYSLLYYRNPSAGIEAGTLTELGEIYVHMSSFDSTYHHPVTGCFPATDYMKSEYVTLQRNSDPQSDFPLQIENFGHSRVVSYFVDVPQAGTYPLTLRMASEENLFAPVIEVYAGEERIASAELPVTGSIDNWETRSIPVVLEAGKQKLTLKSKKNTTCKLSWLSLDAAVVSSLSPVVTGHDLALHRYDDRIEVTGASGVMRMELYDMNGASLGSIVGTNEMSLTPFAKGAYVLRVVDGNQNVSVFRLIF